MRSYGVVEVRAVFFFFVFAVPGMIIRDGLWLATLREIQLVPEESFGQ